LNIFLYLYGKSVFSFFDATKIISHQLPPSHQSGHPKAIFASLLPDEIPSHHLPDDISIVTSS
jgi:hypothetical protein